MISLHDILNARYLEDYQTRQLHNIPLLCKMHSLGVPIPKEYLDPTTGLLLDRPVYVRPLGKTIEHVTMLLEEAIPKPGDATYPIRVTLNTALRDRIRSWRNSAMIHYTPSLWKKEVSLMRPAPKEAPYDHIHFSTRKSTGAYRDVGNVEEAPLHAVGKTHLMSPRMARERVEAFVHSLVVTCKPLYPLEMSCSFPSRDEMEKREICGRDEIQYDEEGQRDRIVKVIKAIAPYYFRCPSMPLVLRDSSLSVIMNPKPSRLPMTHIPLHVPKEAMMALPRGPRLPRSAPQSARSYHSRGTPARLASAGQRLQTEMFREQCPVVGLHSVDRLSLRKKTLHETIRRHAESFDKLKNLFMRA